MEIYFLTLLIYVFNIDKKKNFLLKKMNMQRNLPFPFQYIFANLLYNSIKRQLLELRLRALEVKSHVSDLQSFKIMK